MINPDGDVNVGEDPNSSNGESDSKKDVLVRSEEVDEERRGIDSQGSDGKEFSIVGGKESHE